MVFSTKKRFIAGVTCPKCAVMDKLQAYSEGGVDYRECVSCGFKDQMRVSSMPKEVQTRVNTTAEQIAMQTSAVRIIDPKG
ncbi:MAG: YheV family putative zinc ribbon protein [Porticoccaceae bacterium]|nr:YheV family putative zinc ribbon protein [Porticoccaceae bacterium]MDG1474983.1 YheV family putative zinc ribbon protein [Porticoccaceae bacterium]